MNDKKTKNSASRGEFVAEVCRNNQFSVGHKSIVLSLEGAGADVFAGAKAGQFVQVACRELDNSRSPVPLLRRPFSIAAGGMVDGRYLLEIIYRVLGPGTNWLQERHTGDKVNILGPLGNGFSLPKSTNDKTILVGGGVGLPPMFFLAKQLAQKDCDKKIAFAGVQTKEQLGDNLRVEKIAADKPLAPAMVLDQFTSSDTASVIATDDGSCGFSGNAVDAIDEFLKGQADWGGARIYACGPEPMLRAAAELAQRRRMECQVCMEAYMSCGIGICQSCAVAMQSEDKSEKYKLVCTNGPVFDAKAVIWK